MTSQPLTITQMREVEQRAEAAGLSAQQMMTHAGTNAAKIIFERLPTMDADKPTRVLFLCGPGHNGGDGLICAGELHSMAAVDGRELTVQVYFLKPRGEDDTLFISLRDMGFLMADAENDLQRRVFKLMLRNADVIVDALLGIGNARPRPIEGDLRAILRAVAEKRELPQGERPVLFALDGITGMNYDTGALDPAAVPADVTITFHAPKVGHTLAPAQAASGEVVVVGIGVEG